MEEQGVVLIECLRLPEVAKDQDLITRGVPIVTPGHAEMRNIDLNLGFEGETIGDIVRRGWVELTCV